MDLSVITEIAEYFERQMGYEIPTRTPFVGRNFNVTRAGIHADGMLKDQEIYNIFDTEKILNRVPAVAVDSHSGAAGIAYWINSYFRCTGENKVDKHAKIVAEIKILVDEEYRTGRNTSMSDQELETLLKKVDPKMHKELTMKSI
jgi:isopropylmalate/homocitrate/citramalate synthase